MSAPTPTSSAAREAAENLYRWMADKLRDHEGKDFLPANVACDYAGQRGFINGMAKIISAAHPPLRWTYSKPTTPGWYWIKFEDMTGYVSYLKDADATAHMNSPKWQFCGPLPLPQPCEEGEK